MKLLKTGALLCLTAGIATVAFAQEWKPGNGPLMTRWAKEVSPQNALPEYPRPQMARKDWMNLNGLWQYQSGAAGDATPIGAALKSRILVPFAVESALSGVMEHHERIWYRRQFTVPAAWQGQQVMLNFGAVDYEAEVFVNGKSLGVHTGGYESFSYDVTPYLQGNGPQELIVRVFDPTEAGGQPRGKQTTKPGGIMYTPTTGIWQTVWLEPVPKLRVENVKMVPDIDKGLVTFTVDAPAATPATAAVINIKDGERLVVRNFRAGVNGKVSIPIKNAKLWSPDSPFLYDVTIDLMDGKTKSDSVASYFGMRKISVGKVGNFQRLLLNNKFVFQIGPLDQGFWPEGLYTAPTDAALRSDIEVTKQLGFNMIRKHIKVEPQRWYYWADKLGVMVWQDMPSCNSYIDNPPPIDKAAFEKQLNHVITTHWNHPSIIMWVIFNENQARHDTIKLVNIAKTLDPTRLVNRDSGAGYEGADNPDGAAGDVDDVHSYPPPNAPNPDPIQASACGEYGGIGYIVQGHTWNNKGWGYTTIQNAKELEDLYGEFTGLLKKFQDEKGLSAAVYTEITDVEIESNGLMTYDRVLKCDPAQIALANHFKYPVPVYKIIVPTSEGEHQNWKYTFAQPAGDWNKKEFNDANWQQGRGGFGTEMTPGIGKLGTVWNTPDIWLRRTVTLPNLSAQDISQLIIRDYHDEDVQVYINGVLAYESGGYIANYESKPLREEGKKAIISGGENVIAVHCHQTGGGQYVDVGITQRIPAK